MSLIDILQRWQRQHAELRALDLLGQNGRESLARDINVSGTVLADLVRADRGEELPSLLRAVDVDSERVQRECPAVLRDMAVVCTACREVGRCNRELDAGSASLNYRDYCPNSHTIDMLLQEDLAG